MDPWPSFLLLRLRAPHPTLPYSESLPGSPLPKTVPGSLGCQDESSLVSCSLPS